MSPPVSRAFTKPTSKAFLIANAPNGTLRKGSGYTDAIMSIDWKQLRAEFPALGGWTYLNSATMGQLPQRGVDAMTAHFDRRVAFAGSDFLAWMSELQGLREALGHLIDAGPEDIGFVSHTSHALSMLMNGIHWQPGDRIVTLADEFPNQIYFAAHLQKLGVEFVEAPWPAILDAITPNTRVVLASTVNYNTGFRVPAAELCRVARERGAISYLDGTQSLGALRFSVKDVQPDVFASHGYKWLLSPPGAAFMYVRPEVRQWLEPRVIGWRSHKDWSNVDHLHHGAPEFSETAEKYEGGFPCITVLCAMEASVRMMLEVGPQHIENRVKALAGHLREMFERMEAGLLYGDQEAWQSPIVAAKLGKGLDPSLVARQLKEQKIVVSARHGRLRVAPHFYNDESDIETLERALSRIHDSVA